MCKQIALELQQLTSEFELVKRSSIGKVSMEEIPSNDESSYYRPCLLERGRIHKKVDLIHYNSTTAPTFSDEVKKQPKKFKIKRTKTKSK